MPIITVKEFADLCGDAAKSVEVWIIRGKLMVQREGKKKLINTEDPINLAFIAERQLANSVKELGESALKSLKTVTEKPKTVSKPAKSEPKISKKVTKAAIGKADTVKIKPEKTVKQAPIPASTAESFAKSQKKLDQDMEKKALEIENLELSKQQKLLFLNKSAGQLLPVDLVKGVVKRHADVILKSFEIDFVKMATVFCNIMAGGDQSMLVRVIKESKELLSKSIERAGVQADEEVAILISDFSKTLERGQKRT